MMETVRVDIVYRPLRIGFALLSTDLDNYRKAIRLCHAFWGGRYNPLIPVDRPEPDQLVELFRPDFLVPLGELADVATFVGKYNYLPRSYHLRELFSDGRARLLDVRNQFIHWRERGVW